MTDNEIIKDCKGCLHYEACKGTYYSAKGDEDILHEFEGEMYGHSGCENFEDKDLIKRQKANSEGLLNAVKFLNEKLSSAKAEAVKELLDKLIDISVCKTNGDGTESLYVSIPKARQVLKEMVGEKNDT